MTTPDTASFLLREAREHMHGALISYGSASIKHVTQALDALDRALAANPAEQQQAAARAEERAERLRRAAVAVMGLMDEGVLVRDISRDLEPGFAMRALRLVVVLKELQEASDALTPPSATPTDADHGGKNE